MTRSQADEISLLRKELEEQIAVIEKRMADDQASLQSLKLRLKELINQEKERAHYLSSSEILELIYHHTGKESNMSTIKRWADQGFLGEVIDEKEVFWALKTKQGKKRFLYPKKQVYRFLFDKALIRPRFDILDRVRISDSKHPNFDEAAVVVKSGLMEDEFYYTLQTETSFSVVEQVAESWIKPI
ncbi:hypothetical protein [Ammoniphilus sp. 3BR4]|uniref:hypothetical protein n=1 Tax=Ammoniphilus sp. 3BR4 TaxID=3158265 RepID=UPI0034666B9F